MPDQPEGARTLAQHLIRIVNEEPGLDLDPKFAGAVRPVARKLLERGQGFAPEELAKITASAEMAAIVAGIHLRSVDVLEFYKPLLKHCLAGTSKAPVKDLRRTAAQARALMALLGEKQPSEMRDKVLLMATEAAARVEKWLPRKVSKGGGPAAPRYRPGTFHETEDEEGNPVERKAPVVRVKRERPEGPLKKIFGWLLTLVAVGGMIYGVVWFLQNNQPEPLTVDRFTALVPDVTAMVMEEREMVLIAKGAWAVKRPEHRESDLRLLFKAGDRNKPKSLRVEDPAGTLLGRLDEAGGVSWGDAALQADAVREQQEQAMEELEELRRRPATADGTGKLSRPLAAGEIPAEIEEVEQPEEPAETPSETPAETPSETPAETTP
jgi:hypothetical protein